MLNQSNRKISVMLADDHALVLEGLRGLLSRESDMEVVATVTSGAALIDELQYNRPDVIVLDLQMQDGDGLWCLEEIRRHGLPIKIVILSAFGDGGTIQTAWERNADGFALKTDPPRQTIATIRNVAHGQLVFPRSMRQTPPEPRGGVLRRLTERERDVLRLLSDGHTNAQIAERLIVQESTVKFHVQNILQKLCVSNRTEAAQVFFREMQEK
ncbi:MAG TPA: response regulator transcription factor [Kouleothrix sp.]|uniref:response regulator n=1 Tax=Kouleothrix sp. TaxID=2779161 RepID=UPI002CAE60BE|nr:response regulator transcription factor [Kouleothrix sp.]HRC74900.1 response regulator transcription factor [Kouleothrix sp.]